MLSTAANYTVHASMSGMRKADMTVLVSDGLLFIEAERQHPTQEASPQLTADHTLSASRSLPQLGTTTPPAEQQLYTPLDFNEKGEVQTERTPGGITAQPSDSRQQYRQIGLDRVESCILLPADSDVTAMTARWRDGVLEVVIPREQREASEAMKIDVL